ncbi:MAG: hypothetical protein KAH22_05580 [Thiotrichaceae bacterium]|nr:hypothetical protein [Thiotrichaceae bacterium]
MAMSRAIKAQRYNQGQKLEISLFPFLSIFLCVMGVLSFINVLSSFSTPQKIELTAKLEHGYKVAYQIFSLPDGMISLPPVTHLQKLKEAVDNTDKKTIEEIIQRRKKAIRTLEQQPGSAMDIASSADIIDIVQITHDIRVLNELALKANHLYEEFLLFGIYPNGGQVYQKIRDVMTLLQDARSISIGLEPLDPNWTLNIKKSVQR